MSQHCVVRVGGRGTVRQAAPRRAGREAHTCVPIEPHAAVRIGPGAPLGVALWTSAHQVQDIVVADACRQAGGGRSLGHCVRPWA